MTNNVRGYIQLHPFHLVGPSPWPIFTSFSLMNLALSLGLTAHGYISNNIFIFISIITVLYSMTLWFKDIIAESTYLGDHTIAVKRGLNQGFLLFVVSEILIFSSLKILNKIYKNKKSEKYSTIIKLYSLKIE